MIITKNTGKSVAVDAVEMVEDVLYQNGFRETGNTRLYSTKLLQGIFYPPLDYGNVRVSQFPTPKKITRMLKTLSQEGIIACIDWYSHLSSDEYHRDATPRRYIPSWDLCKADLSNDRIYAEGNRIISGTPKQPRPTFSPYKKDIGFKVPDVIIQNLLSGTRLIFDQDLFREWWLDLLEEDLADAEGAIDLFLKIRSSLHWVNGEIKPSWKHTECGRIYSCKPYIQGLPKQPRRCLRHIHDYPLYCADFGQQELRILCALAGVHVGDEDLYKKMGDRDIIKKHVNPILYGRTDNRIYNNPEHCIEGTRHLTVAGEEQLRLYNYTEAKMTELGVMDTLQQIRKTKGGKHKIRRMGAQMFLLALERCYRDLGLEGGIPLHDGWIFPCADERTADDVKQIFEDASKEICGVKIPVNGDWLCNSAEHAVAA